MDDRRRRQAVGEHYHQEAPRMPTRSQSRKPPPGSWQPTVPSWEKKFCILVGSIPWRKVLEAKKLMSFYENVLQWNDSAGEEAFHNAKNRFWAEINGLPCDISLPDPDIYIDKIDWDSDIDPKLLLDLERELDPPDEDENEEKSTLIGDSLFFLNCPVPCSGWGDVEENPVKTTENSLKSGLQDFEHNVSNANNPWEHNCTQGNKNLENNTWADYGDNLRDSNQWENNCNYYNGENPEPRSNGNWGTWKESYRQRDNASRYMSRYKTSRFQGDYQTDHGWKNGRGRKRDNFLYERPLMDKKPLASQNWNSINSCRPINHPGTREVGNPCSWKKPVS